MLATILPEAARRFGDHEAVTTAEGWSLTYDDLHGLSDEVAAGLAARGLGEGDMLSLVLPSTADYLVAYLAAAKLGAITSGVNPHYTPAERDAVLAVARPRVVLTAAPGPASPPPGCDVLEVQPPTGPDDVLPGLRGHEAEPPPLDRPDDPGRDVVVVFTSGTTGTPKGAVFGNAELAAVAAADLGPRADTWGGGGPVLAATQFAHIGMMTKLPWYLRSGSTVCLLGRWTSSEVLRVIAQRRITSVGGVAPQMALLLRDPLLDELDLSHVQTIVMGGAASPPAMVAEARARFGAAYSIRYSSTESGGVGTATAFDADDEEALHTVGRPRGDMEVVLRDPQTGSRTPRGEVGEITFRSSTMLRRYWNDPGGTAATLRRHDDDGPPDLAGPEAPPPPIGDRGRPWVHSGDLAHVDDRGFLRMAGRHKEMYIRGGYNVYPMEVEAVLASHPAVADVAVVPRPDPVMGEIGVAVVVPRDPAAPPSLEELRRHAAERLARFKLPEAVRPVDALPLTAMQKVDRARLAAVEATEAADHAGR